MKRAIVTGGGKGIGLGITQVLLKEGYNVMVVSRKESEDIAKLKVEYSGAIEFYPCDISDTSAITAFKSYLIKNRYALDLLVNDSGVAPKVRKDILEILPEDFDYLTNINLRGTFFMTQAIADIMRAQKFGRIINISSISAEFASINRGEYCISKAGISMITKLFAVKMAEYNVGVFEIRPGIVETAMTEKVKDKYQRQIEDGLTLIKRMGQPSDIAACILAVAGGNLDYCTGQVINADGGLGVRRL